MNRLLLFSILSVVALSGCGQFSDQSGNQSQLSKDLASSAAPENASLDAAVSPALSKLRSPIVDGWPDMIRCRASGGRYVVLPIWNRGALGNTAYGNPDLYVLFDSAKVVTEIKNPGLAALQDSDCTLGKNLAKLQNYSFTKTSASLIADFPDSIRCQAPGGKFMVLFNWLRGDAGNVAYGTASAMVRFSPNGKLLDTTGDFASLKESDCTAGRDISDIQGFSFDRRAASGMVPGTPDLLMCKTTMDRYVILYNWVVGNAGNIAYGAWDSATVAFDPTTLKINRVDGTYAALINSDCRLGAPENVLTMRNLKQ